MSYLCYLQSIFMNRTRLLFSILTFSIVTPLFAQFYPDAGLVIPLSEDARMTVSSGSNEAAIRDHDQRTFWESGAPLPEAYISRKELNILAGKFDGAAFDSELGSMQTIDKPNAQGLFELTLTFPEPVSLKLISVKAQVKNTLLIRGMIAGHKTDLGIYSSSENYSLKTILTNQDAMVSAINLSCTEDFGLFELAALGDYPYEYVTFDFMKPVEIGQVYTRHLSGANVIKTTIELSNDGIVWTSVANLNPRAIPLVPVILMQPMMARYLRLVHYLDLIDYTKAAIWEVKVYDRYGPFGPPPVFERNPKTIGERLGINGLWGWGYNTYSDNLPAGQGPALFNQVATLGRNYHNLLWDINTPAETIDYQSMAQGNGTKVNWWLNWDREYACWKKFGLQTSATIMFQEKTVPSASWTDPFQNAYEYGKNFAHHFGSENGNGLVSMIEAGNEPWDYPQGFYAKILKGMAKGVKDGDLKMKVIPAALQATFVMNDGHEDNNYIGSNLPQDAIAELDGLNAHFYSHCYDREGVRVTVNPEDPRSALLGTRNMIRFRDTNMPGKPVYVTEYGIECQGAGEDCSHSECVSENQQAAWGIRAALILMRNNADAVYWYFFANEYTASALHTRSGLTGSVNTSFLPKASFFAFKHLLATLGDCTFEQVLAENEQVYAYFFSTKSSDRKYLVAWVPKGGDPAAVQNTSVSLPFIPKEMAYLDGSPTLQWIPFNTSTKQQNINLKGYPVLIKF